jgi:hypothetical protein
MALKGDVFSVEFTREPLISNEHPPIIVVKEIPAEATEKIERGTWVALDENGLIVPYDGTNDPIGILVEDVDPEKGTIAQVLVHGVVVAEKTNVGGNAPTADDWAKFNYRIVGK